MSNSKEEEELQKRIERKKNAAIIKEFKLKQHTFLMTSRFNTATRQENQSFREKSWANGCLYCSPEEVSQRVPPQAKMLVLEMDNDKNQVFAVGMCANKPFMNKYSVYGDMNYNRFNYIGKHRIKREELSEREEAVFKALDQLCFFGNDHMKRGHGLKAFPVKLLVNCRTVIDITDFIEKMFAQRFPSTK